MTPTVSNWLDFLITQHAVLGQTATPATPATPAFAQPAPAGNTAATPVATPAAALGEVVGFGVQAPGRDGFVAPLTDLGLIAAAGDDAASFLHGQLTNDVEHLDLGHARLAGYCTPKGRLLATMLIWKTGDAILLCLPREIQPAIQKRLQMFIMRAKAKLADVADTEVVLGLAGPASSLALAHWFEQMPQAPYAKADSRAGTLIRLADADGAARYQWITTVEIAQQAWARLTETLEPKPASAWRRLDILAGIPQVTRATQEQFVPQMINYEAIGGVNFKKGCYPGQEIVTRSQYLGKLKRRMILASVAKDVLERALASAGREASDADAAAGHADAAAAHAGTEVFSSTDPQQPCGMLVNAERAADGGLDCLVEIKTAMLEAGTLHLGSADGMQILPSTLPYLVPEPD
ncbi:MAG: YgfZ/GcvT domain-containing protein [Janthinobacterium lividum]